ncbi:MAG: class II aldolase/adducin family protein [Desulfobacterales bacterium]|nr:class II aldolase/adducin family protein [Deltaproteobacteria bacterium]MBT8362515.1 class II aldolase/adducin family protein [Deltaproteobacteria bacterium]NNK93222.1 class II aldolase/adducin family protein [Desulfobacterales bacterium]
MTEPNVTQSLSYYARRAYKRGLVGGTGGNFSARIGQDKMVITASGLSLGDTAEENLIEMDISTYSWQPKAEYIPSKEYLFHADILRLRPDVAAVLHIHPPYATTFAVLRRDIPMVTDAAFKQPKIPRVPFAPSGTEELQSNVVNALEEYADCKVLLLEQHGIICLGSSVRWAYDIADLTEELARIAYLKEMLSSK